MIIIATIFIIITPIITIITWTEPNDKFYDLIQLVDCVYVCREDRNREIERKKKIKKDRESE